MKILKVLFYSVLLLSLEQVTAAVSVSVTPGAQLFITPGVDISREIVATMTLNADQPYNVSISDNNGGALKNGELTIPFRISYNNNSEITPSIIPTIVETGSLITDGEATVAVSIFGSDTATSAAGNYTTTLTLTITGL